MGLTNSMLACEQGLWGAVVGEGEGELSTTSLELEYVHRKSQCEMLIGGDNIRNDVITLHMFFFAFVSTLR